ncbi:hypothetical protein JST97_33625 [bacterium]|nr:hypothetical protein [bacterium]
MADMKIQTFRATFKKALDYTNPRPTTASNYEKPQLLQAASSASIAGFYMMGPAGAVTQTAATIVGLKAQEKCGNKWVGAAAGAATGATLAALAGHVMGTPGIALQAALGGVGGAFCTLRTNQVSRFRDAGGYGLTFGSPLAQGGAKAALGLSSVLAAEVQHEGKRAVVAAGLGAATGVALSMTGMNHLSPLVSAAACAGLSVFASVCGPRAAMTMRNAGEDIGQKMAKGKPQTDRPHEKSLTSRIIGTLPMAGLRQSVTAFTMGKFDPISIGVGFAIDASTSAYEVYLNHKHEQEQAAKLKSTDQTPPPPK